MAMSESAAVKPEDADLNVGAWIEPNLIVSIQRRIRDNVGVNEDIRLVQPNGTGRGQISSQRIVGAFFNQRTLDDFSSAARFDKELEAALRTVGYVRHEPLRPVTNSRSSMTVGFQTVATVATGKCFMAKVGYRFGKPTIYSNDNNNPDTLLHVRYCQQADEFPDLEALVSRVAIADSGDVAAIRRRMAELPSAGRDERPIAVEWSGYDKPIAGMIELQQARGGGTVRMTLPNNDGQCSGSYRLEPGRGGTWEISCTNGLTASGTLRDHGAGRGSSGEGTDSKGRSIKYTLGAS